MKSGTLIPVISSIDHFLSPVEALAQDCIAAQLDNRLDVGRNNVHRYLSPGAEGAGTLTE